MKEETSPIPVSQQLLDIAQEYKKMMFFYEAGIEMMLARLQILNKQYRMNSDRNPIESIQHRIKSMQSIQDKMNRKGISITLENIMTNLYDIAGVRVICSFKDDVYKIASFLMRQDDIMLIKMKDYIENPKPNGYRSLHLILTIDVCFEERKAQVPIELQLRTIAMDFWASLEHQLRYKKNFALVENADRDLKTCADTMADADERMQRLATEVLKEK